MESGTPSRVRPWIIWLVVLLPITAVLLSGLVAAAVLPGCESCHDRDGFIEATQRSSHGEVACGSCHVSSGLAARVGFGYRLVFHMALPVVSGEGRDWDAVPDNRCLSCHEKINETVVKANGIRIDHAVCAEGSACTDCHSTAGHGKATTRVRVYDMDTCLECHTSEEATKCDLCHEGRGADDRITSGVFAVTHGPQWEKTHGMGNSNSCAACHTAASCEKCHGPGLPHGPEFLTEHSAVSQDPKAKCSGCHTASFCDDCHGLKMPHSRAFTRGHAKPAEVTPKLCERCHVKSDCVTCHETHVHPGGAVAPNSPAFPWKSGGQ